MKKNLFLILFISIISIGLTQVPKGVYNNSKKFNRSEVVSSDINQTKISFTLEAFEQNSFLTERGQAVVYNAPKGVSILKKGAPDLLKFVSPIIVPDRAKMEVVVTKSSYKEYTNVLIAPSKGNLYRNIEPEKIPYVYGHEYSENKFYPEQLVDLGNPYIIRDYRGQAVNFYPFQYNPVTKVLRIYSKIDVKVQAVSMNGGDNPLIKTKAITKVDSEFEKIYKRHFINYPSLKYTPLGEQGNMLIISYGSFMSDMQPFINWKKLIGIPTEIIDVATIGNNSTAIKNYVSTYYSQKGLTFLILVGDASQVATNTLSTGHSDNAYGYITGNDSYPEIFVGRFSAENVGHVQTQVQRSVDYERNPLATAWLSNGFGMASSEGAGIGHNGGESDIQHEAHIRSDLLGFTYATVTQLDETTSGPTIAQVSAVINSGASVINYTGHGSETSWGTSGFSNTNINNLTNAGMLPFIWSVGCVNGAFVNTTCFGEAWLRATSSNQPIGAVATLMSTINQSWAPPMTGQDEMNDILVETYANNIKRTFGGISMNGCMYMNDVEGSAGAEMTDTWNLFGDPSLMVRTDEPQTMTVSHPQSILLTETQMQISCNVNDAFVSLTVNNEIIGTGSISGGTVTIAFAQLPTTDSITVAVTAFNYMPYFGKVAVQDFQYSLDAGILQIIEPESNYNCINLNITPKVVLRNMGLNTLNSVTVNYKLNSATVQQFIWNGSLASLATDTITLPAFNLTQGSHTYQVYTSDPNGSADLNTGNDSKTQTFTVQDLPLTSSFDANITNFCMAPGTVSFNNLSQNALGYLWDFGDGQTSTEENPVHTYSTLGTYSVTLTTNAGVCGQEVFNQTDFINVGLEAPQITPAFNCGPGSITMQASATGGINWFSDDAGTNLIGTGNTYVTPVLNSSTTYYVQATSANQAKYAGKTDSIGSGGYFGTNTFQHYLIFDSYVPFRLLSVKVYAGSTADRTIILKDSTGATLSTITVNVPAGESRVTLNFDVPVGTKFRLVGGGNPNLFRNNNNSASYPYDLPGVLSITESSASLPQFNAPGNYYYFYDWEVKENDCTSPIIPFVAEIYAAPVAAYTSNINGTVVTFTQTATQAVSYFWDFGDGSTSTLPNPTHTYATIGSFDAKLVVTNPCGSDSITQTIVTTVAAPMADFSADNDTVYEGDYVHFTDLSANAPTSWSWNFEAGTPGTSTVQNPVIQYNTAGIYYVSLEATNTIGSNTMNKSAFIIVLENTGIADAGNLDESLTIYPNPAKEKTIISFNLIENSSISMKLYNSIGAVVYTIAENSQWSKGKHVVEVNTSSLSSGIYFIELQDNKSKAVRKLLIF